MRRRRVMRGVSLVLAAAVAGCATYDPVVKGLPARLDLAGPNVTKAGTGELTLYVEEYATHEKSESAFDTRLAEEGVLALLILMHNNGPHEYEVDGSGIVLRGKTVTNALTAEQAAGKAERSAVGRALGWSLIVPIISIPVAVVASAVHTNKVNKQIVQDFTAKRFADGVIAPNTERSGFVFFDLEADRKDLSGLTLEVVARNMSTGDTVTISTPLPPTTIVPRKSPSEEARGEHRF
jgi:hypothetical protein